VFQITKQPDKKEGRVHPFFLLQGTATDPVIFFIRLSSSDQKIMLFL